jgi:large subunit ribosomal protein L34e
MVEGKKKSRTFRRVYVKTPGNKVVIHYRKRKHSKAECAGCGAGLIAVPRERPFKMRNMPKTHKRPERPYGGYFCSKCARKKIVAEARLK